MTQGNAFQTISIISSGVRRPSWSSVPKRQNVVCVRDASSSMQGEKAKQASAASFEMVDGLSSPVNKDAFTVALVDFSDTAQVVCPLQKATVLKGRMPPISTGGGTSITSGLEDGMRILRERDGQGQKNIHHFRPVVILFSDGCHNVGPHPRKVAEELKKIADIVTVAFGSDADEGLLRELASSPQHFYRCASGRELRRFFAAVGETLTATMTAGVEATRALTMIHK